MWQRAVPVGLIDWDHAGPRPPSVDVLYALDYTAPFRDDTDCVRWLGYPGPPDRRRRIEIFCDAYGIVVPEDVVGQIAQQQELIMHHCRRLARQGVEPQATWVRQGHLERLRSRIDWSKSLKL